jgi:hypothetical protein
MMLNLAMTLLGTPRASLAMQCQGISKSAVDCLFTTHQLDNKLLIRFVPVIVFLPSIMGVANGLYHYMV